MWKNNTGESVGFLPGRKTVGPLLLMGLTPLFVILASYTCQKLDGSLWKLAETMWSEGVWQFFARVHPSWTEMQETIPFIAGFMVFELALMKIAPGKEFRGPISPSGHVPVYKDNGISALIISVLAYFACVQFGVFPGGYIYQIHTAFIAAMNIFSLLFCLMLYIKGHIAPSGKDSGSSGHVVVDYYWGMELYPRILDFDLKVFTNCRFGMMAWAIFPIDFAWAQYNTYGYLSTSMIASVTISTIYCIKFFWWESGYWCSMDIQHDRAGYYICWGCLVWVPGIYVSQPLYLVNHPIQIANEIVIAIIIAGLLCVWINYTTDKQRQDFRTAFRNKTPYPTIWGKEPEWIPASYKTESGQTKKSALLCSGFLSFSRKFQYIPEILGSFFCALPAGFTHFMPYFYTVFLTGILVDRAARDDARCASKYGDAWAKYVKKVPYQIVPFLW